jgi:hypothetical protein
MKCSCFNNWRISPAVCNLICVCYFPFIFCYLLKCVWIWQSVDLYFLVSDTYQLHVAFHTLWVLSLIWSHLKLKGSLSFHLASKHEGTGHGSNRTESGVGTRLSWQGKSHGLPHLELLVSWSSPVVRYNFLSCYPHSTYPYHQSSLMTAEL